jgi:hypothetical protein
MQRLWLSKHHLLHAACGLIVVTSLGCNSIFTARTFDGSKISPLKALNYANDIEFSTPKPNFQLGPDAEAARKAAVERAAAQAKAEADARAQGKKR